MAERITVWGLSFKPNTDDIRFSAATLTDTPIAAAEGAIVQAYNPQAMESCKRKLESGDLLRGRISGGDQCEAIIVPTEWDQLRKVDWARLATLVERPLVLDGRNALAGKDVAAHGFEYVGIGGIRRSSAYIALWKHFPNTFSSLRHATKCEIIERTTEVGSSADCARPVKWVVVSDRSTDGTDEGVQGYSATNPWIDWSVFQSAKNATLPAR